eukprot:196179_1
MWIKRMKRRMNRMKRIKKSTDIYVDEVGDIHKRLKTSNVNFQTEKWDGAPVLKPRVFRGLYQTLYKFKDGMSDHLHRKRLIAVIDRRRSKSKDDEDIDNIWMYEPPKGRDIPSDAVPEWYINSSKCCLFPPDIGAQNSFGSSALTLSFHVRQEKVIKCYLFWSGQMIRFMAEDVRTVLPNIFNMKYPGNQDLIDGNNPNMDLDEIIAEIKGKLVDEEFDAFVSSEIGRA